METDERIIILGRAIRGVTDQHVLSVRFAADITDEEGDTFLASLQEQGGDSAIEPQAGQVDMVRGALAGLSPGEAVPWADAPAIEARLKVAREAALAPQA